MDKKVKERDGFRSRWGFILACIGSAVGMGNIWRFPILVSAYGGMTFLIPYIIFVVLIGNTGVINEMALGRFAQAGPVTAFGKSTKAYMGKEKIGQRIGIIPIVGSLALAIGYTCVMAWVFKYTYLAFSGKLFAMGDDMDLIGSTFSKTAGAFGANVWIVIAILLSTIIMSFGIANGIEKANKIMMPLLFVLFIGLGIYIASLPGASYGYKYIFTTNTKALRNPEVWIYAFGQAFFSLSVAGNGTVIYGSYLSKKEDLPSAARNVAIFDTLAAFIAALVIIPAMALAKAPLDEGGPGLMFVYLVKVLNTMPGGKIVGMIFYLCILFAGLSSIINLYEAPVAYLEEKFKIKRIFASLIILCLGCLVAIFIQPIVSDWMDFVSIYLCPLGAFLAAVMFMWLIKKEDVLKAVNEGAKKPIGAWYYPLSKYLYTIAALVALIAGAIFGGIGWFLKYRFRFCGRNLFLGKIWIKILIKL